MRKYEIMYIVNASLDDATRTSVIDGLHKIITDHKGSIDKINDMGVKEFAYEIDDMTKGYYVVINITCEPDAIHEFDRLTRINNNVVRYLIIKTEDEK